MLNGIFFNTPIEDNYLGYQIAEIFKDNVYAPYLAGRKDLTILDIGANLGVASYYFSQFAAVVHALEPAQEHYDVLTHMLAFNKLTNVIPHRIALSQEDGEAVFFHDLNKTMHSLRPANVRPESVKEVVPTMRLATFLAQEKIKHVDFMKLDIEGSEADVVCGDGFQSVSQMIDTLVLEVHSWNGRHPNQLKDALQVAGFTLSTIPNDAMLLIARRTL
jgi:FkbM family methyltransferase